MSNFFVTGGEGGFIQFEWTNGNKYLEISFDPDNIGWLMEDLEDRPIGDMSNMKAGELSYENWENTVDTLRSLLEWVDKEAISYIQTPYTLDTLLYRKTLSYFFSLYMRKLLGVSQSVDS